MNKATNKKKYNNSNKKRNKLNSPKKIKVKVRTEKLKKHENIYKYIIQIKSINISNFLN